MKAAARGSFIGRCARLLLSLATGTSLLASGSAISREAPPSGPGTGHHPVLMISIDGLRPGDITDAEARGLRVPNLRRFLKTGTFASGVTGVLPTLTYPSHTTLITGAAPARHGIVNNTTFDPMAFNQDGWYWYASDVRAQTLWDSAGAAGLTTGNVHWPVSVGAKLTWNLPQIWRTGHADDAKLLRALATPGLLDELQPQAGTYAAGIDESVEADEVRARFAERLIARHHPDFLTVYLTGLDHTQHAEGPGSAPAHAVLERIDTAVGKLIVAERAARPDAVIVVVSDHGFAPVDTAINLSRVLIDAGLLKLTPPDPFGKVKIASWEAAAWTSGGTIAVMLARPEETALRERVRSLLLALKADPANRITAILEPDAIARAGGNPQAAFYLALGDGMMAVPYLGPTVPLRIPAPSKGMHGYLPEDPRMQSTLLIAGPGIPAGLDLGHVDMRAIAPTVAAEMGLTLSGAELPVLDLTVVRKR